MFRWRLFAGIIACALPSSSWVYAQDAAIRVRDDADRVVVLEAMPERIVSLVPVATEILFDLEEGWRLVGRSRFDDFPAEARLIPVVGDAIRPSVEAVLLRDPDLVILVGGSDNADAVREMERLGIPHFVVLFNTLDDLRTNLGRLGQIVDREAEALAIWKGIEANLAAVGAAVSGRPRPGVYYDVGYPPAFTIGAGSYLDALLTLAGGRNVFGDLEAPSPRVGLEAIMERDPDVIVHPVGPDWPGAGSRPEKRPGWNHLRAVRTGAVVEVPSELLHRLGPRVDEAARALALALHPDAAEDLSP